MPKMIFLLLSLLALPFFLFIFLKYKNNVHLNLPSGPPSLPFFGHLHLLMIDNSVPHLFFWKLSQKYGSLVSLRFGFKSILVVSSVEMAKEVMKTHDLDFCSRPLLHGAQKFSYNGSDIVFAPYNAHWREIRKICIVHLFNSNRAQSYSPIREGEVAHLIDKISRSSIDSKPVNLSEAMMLLMSTIICRVGFNKRHEEEGAEKSKFHELFNETQSLFATFFSSDFFPFMGWVGKFSGLLNRLEKNFKQLDAFYQGIIDEHLNPNSSQSEQQDIVDILLQIWRDRDITIDFNMNHIKAILMNVFLAGTETTAATVIWTMTFLMKNQRCMKKVQEEIRKIIGEKGFVSEHDIQGLTYLKAVIKEALRLQPPLPLLIPRETMQNCNIGGYEIPAKTFVHVNAWAIGRDPEVWKNPEEFYPERFIDNFIDYKGLDFGFIPFGAGRRICPGIHMGVATVELTLANLLYKFDWEMPADMSNEDLDLDVMHGVVEQKKNALCLVPKKINV